MSTARETHHGQITPEAMVGGVVRLVSLPEVCLRVSEMLEDPLTTAKDLGKVIGRDTGLTARLLKIVNSAFYGFPSRIETVSRAVTVIGMRELRGLVLAASAIEAFSRVSTDVLNMAHFWRHSVYCGVVAQILASRCRVLHGERLFVAGLLHDIGKLIIANKKPDIAVEVMRAATEEEALDFEVEQRLMGFDHAELGGLLLEQWKMPESLCDAVRFHHAPQEAKRNMLDASLIHIANVFTCIAELGLDIESSLQPIEDYAWQTSGLQPDIMHEVLAEAGPRFTDALEAVLPRSYLS